MPEKGAKAPFFFAGTALLRTGVPRGAYCTPSRLGGASRIRTDPPCGGGTIGETVESAKAIVIRLETELLQPATRSSIARLDELLADDFLEVGAAGQAFGKAAVLARLPGETGAAFTAGDMQAHLLSPTVVLVSYRATRTSGCASARSLRSSIWIETPTGWRMRYHQGTYETAARGDDAPADAP